VVHVDECATESLWDPREIQHCTWVKGILWRICDMRHRKSKFCGAFGHMRHRSSSFAYAPQKFFFLWHMYAYPSQKVEGFFLPTQLHPPGSPFLALQNKKIDKILKNKILRGAHVLYLPLKINKH
jgi:hypothetical protein